MRRQPSAATITGSRSVSALRQSRANTADYVLGSGNETPARPASPSVRRVSHAPLPQASTKGEYPAAPRPQQSTTANAGYTPLIDAVTNTIRDPVIAPIQLPPALTADDFTRAVAVATVSALRHQQHQEAMRPRLQEVPDESHGGHDAPSWSRALSASVLLGCTVLYAVIAGTFALPMQIIPILTTSLSAIHRNSRRSRRCRS